MHASQFEDDDTVIMIIGISVCYQFKLNSLKLYCSSPSVMAGGIKMMMLSCITNSKGAILFADIKIFVLDSSQATIQKKKIKLCRN